MTGIAHDKLEIIAAALITGAEKGAIVSAAGASSCGKRAK